MPYAQILKHKRLWFIISGVIVVLCIAVLAIKGLNFGIDFTGGTEIDLKCQEGTTVEQVRGVVAGYGYGDAKIQQITGEEEYNFVIRTPFLDEGAELEIEAGFQEQPWFDSFAAVYSIGPGWGSHISRQAIIALIIFLVAILIYISFRFDFKMAICAIVALFHDVMITVGIYALIGKEVTPATVIAVLTILGYSLYDTIVIFDRVKENADQLTRQSKKTYSEMVNDSLNQTLARSINTSLTTLIPIATILIFGGETLKAFAFALFIGVIAGTYSSIFVASTLLALWKETEPKYRAYRDRMERRQTRQERLAAKKEKVAAAKAGETAGEADEVSGKGAGSGVPPGEAKPETKKEPARKEEKAATGQAKPKPKQPQKKTTTSKAAAKSRTKGPGSGKKKKKKKKKR